MRHRFLCLILIAAVTCGSSPGQATASQPQSRSSSSTQRPPIPLPHLYRAFLLYQNFQDQQAAAREQQGKDGKWTRSHLQGMMGFTDAEFAPVRASSERLAAEYKALDAKAKSLRAIGSSTTIDAQLKQLSGQRTADLNAEVAFLKRSLPPDRITAFESFLTQFFSSKSAAHTASSQSSHTAPAAVQ